MKIGIIHHDADLDGILSNRICRYFLKLDRPEIAGDLRSIVSVGWDYGKPVPDVSEFDEFFMVDLAIDSLVTKPNLTAWIDHHKTGLDKFKDLNPQPPGLRIEGVAACRLCWQYFNHKRSYGVHDFANRQVEEPLLLTLVGEQDVGDHHDVRSRQLVLGIGSLSPIEFDELVSDQFLGISLDSLHMALDLGQRAQGAVERSASDIMSKWSHDTIWEGLCWLTINTARAGYLFFQSAVKPRHDGCLMWRYDGNKQFTVIMYHVADKTHLDFTEIAKRYKGGGHPGACGFQCDIHTLMRILNL